MLYLHNVADVLSWLEAVKIFYVDVQQKVRLLSDSTEGTKAQSYYLSLPFAEKRPCSCLINTV